MDSPPSWVFGTGVTFALIAFGSSTSFNSGVCSSILFVIVVADREGDMAREPRAEKTQ